MTLLHVGGHEWLDWNPHPEVAVLSLLLLGAYLYTVTQLRPFLSDAGRVKRGQVLAFSLGVLTIYGVTGSPVDVLAGEYLLTAHMLQHLVLTLVTAPLLLVGTPGWLWKVMLRPRGVLPVARVITHPLLALAAFNGVLLLAHLPSTMDLQLRSEAFHFTVHVALVASGLLMWWPILSPLPELPRLSYPLQMGYLFLQSLLPSVMASFVTFSDHVVYSAYADGHRIWGLSPIDDQQIAGGSMKLVGSLILWSFITAAFFKWYVREEAAARGPPWREIEEELDGLGLTERN